MTKEQFDDDFIHGRWLVQATTMDEWLDLNEYAVRALGVKRSYIWPNHNSTYIPWSEIMPKKNQWFIVDIEKRLGMPTFGSGSTHNVADYSTNAPDIKVEQLDDMVYGSCEKNVELKSCELSDIV